MVGAGPPVAPSGTRPACQVGFVPGQSTPADQAFDDPDGYALPVDRAWWGQHPEWFTKTHHTYPAADLPVPVGTPVYAITNGTVIATTTGGRCGNGLTLRGDDGTTWQYCHGVDGGLHVTTGDTIAAGQHVMDSGNTGRSTGPHLHLGLKINGTTACPQPILEAIATNKPISLTVTTNCVHAWR